MGQKVNPIGLRLKKTNKNYNSLWYGDLFYRESLAQDLLVNRYLEKIFKLIGYPLGEVGFVPLGKMGKILFPYLLPDMSRGMRSNRFRLKRAARGSPSRVQPVLSSPTYIQGVPFPSMLFAPQEIAVARSKPPFQLLTSPKVVGGVPVVTSLEVRTGEFRGGPLTGEDRLDQRTVQSSPPRLNFRGFIKRVGGVESNRVPFRYSSFQEVQQRFGEFNLFIGKKRGGTLSQKSTHCTEDSSDQLSQKRERVKFPKRFVLGISLLLFTNQKWRHGGGVDPHSLFHILRFHLSQLGKWSSLPYRRSQQGLPLWGQGGGYGVPSDQQRRVHPYNSLTLRGATRTGRREEFYQPSSLERRRETVPDWLSGYPSGVRGRGLNYTLKGPLMVGEKPFPSFYTPSFLGSLHSACERICGDFLFLEGWRSFWDGGSPRFLAGEIAYYITRRVPFIRLRNQLLREILENRGRVWDSIEGVRICCSGRTGGRSKKAQRGKKESFQWGRTSLNLLSSRVGFARSTGLTRLGVVGIKVWICYK
jgi:hypothetical protein